MNNVNSLIGDQGATLQEQLRQLLALLPVARHLPHRPVRAQPRGARATAPERRLRPLRVACTRTTTSPSGSKRAGYYTALIGKYLNQLLRSIRPCHRAGRSGTRPPYPRATRTSTTTRSTRTAPWSTTAHDPADFKQDVFTRKAVDFVDRRRPSAKPFFLWLTYTAPAHRGPDPNPNPPYDCRQRGQARARHAHAFDSEPLPTPPNFNEADVSDKPARDPEPSAPELGPDRRHPAQVPLRARIAALGRRGREAGGRRAAGQAASSTTP